VNFGGALLTVPAEFKGSASKNDNASETVTRVTDFGDITIRFWNFPGIPKERYSFGRSTTGRTLITEPAD